MCEVETHGPFGPMLLGDIEIKDLSSRNECDVLHYLLLNRICVAKNARSST